VHQKERCSANTRLPECLNRTAGDFVFEVESEASVLTSGAEASFPMEDNSGSIDSVGRPSLKGAILHSK
jgi:hypothetical protein